MKTHNLYPLAASRSPSDTLDAGTDSEFIIDQEPPVGEAKQWWQVNETDRPSLELTRPKEIEEERCCEFYGMAAV